MQTKEELMNKAEQYSCRSINGNALFIVDDYGIVETTEKSNVKVEISEFIDQNHLYFNIKTGNGDELTHETILTLCPKMIQENKPYRKCISSLIESTKERNVFEKPMTLYLMSRTLHSLLYDGVKVDEITQKELHEKMKKALEVGSVGLVVIEHDSENLEQFIKQYNSHDREPSDDCPFCNVWRAGQK